MFIVPKHHLHSFSENASLAGRDAIEFDHESFERRTVQYSNAAGGSLEFLDNKGSWNRVSNGSSKILSIRSAYRDAGPP